MAFEIFGFEIQSKKKKTDTFVTPENTDGATTVVDGGGIFGHYLNTDSDAKDEKLLIQKYREMSYSQEVDGAIEDILNDAVIQEEGQPVVALDLEALEYNDSIKDKIHAEFTTVLDLLKFNNEGADLFKKWYVDGRLYHHIVIDDTRIKEGIKELIPIDPLNINKVREVEKEAKGNVDLVKRIQEYYIYNPDPMITGSFQQGLSPATKEVIVKPSASVLRFIAFADFILSLFCRERKDIIPDTVVKDKFSTVDIVVSFIAKIDKFASVCISKLPVVFHVELPPTVS